MKFEFIYEHRPLFTVEKMCHAFNVSRGGYYAWLHREDSPQKKENDKIMTAIIEIHEKSRRTYGSPRILAALKAKGYWCGKNRVARLMKSKGIAAKTKRKFKATTNSKHNLPVAPNLLEQNFSVDAPNKVWVSDITYIWTNEGWLYLATVIDLYSRMVVGWAMSARIDRELVIRALNAAIEQRAPKPGIIFHSDRGVQFCSNDFRVLLEMNGFKQSMSRKGNCYDNAVAESFFHSLKTELIFFENYATRASARSSIFDYVEIFYNRERRHSTIGYLTPVAFESLAKVA